MWIAIGAVAIVVLGLAAFAGLGKFGEMPADAVNDRPKGFIPDGPVTTDLLAQLRLPTASAGYKASEVDAYLAAIAAGTAAPAKDTFFTVTRGGYDMQAVDDLIERERYERPTELVADPQAPDAAPETADDEGLDVETIELGEESDGADLDVDEGAIAPSRPSGLPDAE